MAKVLYTVTTLGTGAQITANVSQRRSPQRLCASATKAGTGRLAQRGKSEQRDLCCQYLPKYLSSLGLLKCILKASFLAPL